jgi:hypothetical protein
VLASLLYVMLGQVMTLVLLCFRSSDYKELEIVLLRDEIAVLRRQLSRPAMQPADRVFLAAASRLIARARWRSFFVTPETLLAWHHRLVARRWSYPGRRPGPPKISRDVREVVLRLARENPRWGYQRIAGELRGLGVLLSATTVRELMKTAGIGPAGQRGGISWREFIRGQAHSTLTLGIDPVRELFCLVLIEQLPCDVTSRSVAPARDALAVFGIHAPDDCIEPRALVSLRGPR